MKVCKVNDGRRCLLNEGPVKEVCACKEILGGNFGGCGDLFVYACSEVGVAHVAGGIVYGCSFTWSCFV